MTLFFVFFGVLAAVLFGLRAARQRLQRQKGGPWVSTLKALCTALLYGLPLAAVLYLVFFATSIPRPILVTGGGVSIVFFLLVLNFSAAQKKEREAKKATMLWLLRQHVKARRLEKQVKEWNDNYGM